MIMRPVVPTLATAPTKNQLLGQFLAASSERRVSGDGEQPGGQTGSPLEGRDVADHGEPSVLYHLLGLRAAADDRVRGADQRAVEPAYELTESRVVAAAQTLEKGRIVELDGRRASLSGRRRTGDERDLAVKRPLRVLPALTE